MKNFLLTPILCLMLSLVVYGQDTISHLQMSGSVDIYYKYDLSGLENEDGVGNIGTSFANNHNSVSIGMANLILSQSWQKVGFVADLAFGPRGQGQSILNGEDGNSFHIQNLNVSYAPIDRLTLTAGFMGTFIGYEVISPAGNFNYSTSYLFTNGPFQNAGFKATFDISDKISLMAGLFNEWNIYQDRNGMTDFGAQLSVAPVDGYNFYFNFLTGKLSGTTLDFVSTISFADNWMTGVNFTNQRNAEAVPDYTGLALYQQFTLSKSFDLGIRGEWFKYTDREDTGQTDGPRYLAATLSGNIHLGPLTLIPEVRGDFSTADVFTDGDGDTIKSAMQILMAAVYAF